MAKNSKIIKNEQRKKIVERYVEIRKTLKKTIKNLTLSREERQAAQNKLSSLPRDSSATRVRNRCLVTGRPRGYLRKFGLSRVTFREMALNGEIPGITKSSW
jgi:small subunit ribosomal protein S14